MLERENHCVIEAKNGNLGLQVMKADRPDLIISDIRMPSMSGDEFFRHVRAAEGDLNIIPFIFLSGHIDDDAVVERLNGGATHCLRKPVSAKLLLAHVNSCLSASRRYSEFVSEKLDIIGRALPPSMRRDFKPYGSLSETVDIYFNIIADFLRHRGNGTGFSDDAVPPAGIRQVPGRADRLRYIQFYLDESKRRQALSINSSTEALTWQSIYVVAESQISGRVIYVSDLYFLAQAAKSTINNRLTALVDDQVFVKHSSHNDGRRQSVSMTTAFATAFYAHIDKTIGKITEVMSPPTH